MASNFSDCSLCSLGPPPDMILRLPPPPPNFLIQSSDHFPKEDGVSVFDHFNNSPCKHSCEWQAEGVQYVEMPQQGLFFTHCNMIIYIKFSILTK